jgi:hypothetical protein
MAAQPVLPTVAYYGLDRCVRAPVCARNCVCLCVSVCARASVCVCDACGALTRGGGGLVGSGALWTTR